MTEDAAKQFSRRNFIKGVIATGAVASSSAYLFRSTTLQGQPSAGGAPGTAERLITLNVNGQDRRLDVMPQETLAMTLRYKLGLTGTKIGCDTSQCGSCTVHLDGHAVKSCTVLAAQADGHAVTTIEGIAPAGELHPMQEAFWENHGLQCGFCTPGMIMAAIDLLAENPDATDDEIRHGLEGNLCRCTGYHNIVKAVRAATTTTQAVM